MRIIPRSESGLAPPRGNATGPFEKTCIIIHYTCSPNGILTPETEKGLMQMWQNEHEAKYSAWDILQAFSVFQSGRIYENRIWTSNSGAIYNAGGWSTKGVGIECQGDFRGDVKMSDLQYQALLYLCCSIYIRPGFKPQAGRFIFGHKELYPCRPGDVHSTDCPANLLNQFVVNGKLQNDVLASTKGTPVGAKPKEEDDDMYLSEMGKAACVPSMTQDGMKCYLDITPQYGNPAQVRFQAKRDNGDYVGKAETHDIAAEISYRFEVGKHFNIPNIGGTTVKVEVLSGGPVVVTRKQTL